MRLDIKRGPGLSIPVPLSQKGGEMAEARLVFDLVCGQVVDADIVEHRSDYEGERYYFCCEHCKATFDRNPKLYVRTQAHGPFH